MSKIFLSRVRVKQETTNQHQLLNKYTIKTYAKIPPCVPSLSAVYAYTQPSVSTMKVYVLHEHTEIAKVYCNLNIGTSLKFCLQS